MMKHALLLLLLCGASFGQTVGVYAFMTTTPPSGSDLSNLQSSVLIPGYAAGIVIPTSLNGTISWATIDHCSPYTTNCTHGSYLWGPFDTIVTGIIGSCTACKIGIIVQPASDTSTPTNPNAVTPGYVTNAIDLVTCSSGMGGTSQTPYFQEPALWEPAGIAAYQTWAKEVVRHFTNYDGYSASYWSQVSYVRFGLFIGGEATIPCPYEVTTTLGSYNLTVPVTSAYVTALFSSVIALSPTFKVQGPMYGGNKVLNPAYCGIGLGSGACITQAYPDAEAASEVASGAGIGAESLGMENVIWYAEGQLCLGDACGLFNTYSWTAPIFDWQTYKISDPTCEPWVDPTTCNGGPTGSLVNLLPFATIRMHAGENPNRLTALEIFWQDWMCAYYGSVQSYCPYSYPNPDLAYQAALANAAVGVPNATSSTAGKAAVSGGAAIY
jgi:hypothetical protein